MFSSSQRRARPLPPARGRARGADLRHAARRQRASSRTRVLARRLRETRWRRAWRHL